MNNKNSISKISKSIEDENFNDDVNIKNENSRNFENLNQYHKHEPSEYSQIILKVPVNNYTFNMHKNIDEYTNSQKSIKNYKSGVPINNYTFNTHKNITSQKTITNSNESKIQEFNSDFDKNINILLSIKSKY